MKGRKPKPTVLKILHGSRKPINRAEPQAGELSTVCPEDLIDDAARREWTDRIVPAIAIGQITATDYTFAFAHCELFATYRRQLVEAAKHPDIVAVGPNKHPMPNPARSMANKTLLLLAKVDAELGFSPTSRSRVTVKTHARKDKDRERFFGSS
jgi:P27 family predicted phage terminase small subunit